MITKAAEARDISEACKEGVADSLLNNLSARVSGKGAFSRTISNARPSDLLVSGFIVPYPEERRDSDEEASPLQINALGVDYHTSEQRLTERIRVKLRAAAYVRIFPSASEVARDGPLFPHFELNKEVHKELRARSRAARQALAQELGVAVYKEYTHPDGERRLGEMRSGVHAEFGIPFVPEVHDDAPAEPAEGAEPPAEDAQEPKNLAGKITYGPDKLYESRTPPQKWLRIDLDLPAFELDLAHVDDHRQRITEELNASIAAQLKKWFDEFGRFPTSEFVGYRRGSRILPSHIRSWAEYINAVCADKVQPCVPEFDIRWAISAVPDPLQRGRVLVHVAVENWTKPPARADMAKELECSLFQVEVDVDLPRDYLRPMLLDRVKPSYRYNEYLKYPALGFNCGVIYRKTADTEHLRTTWTPRYVLPRIVPTERPVEKKFEVLSTIAGITGLAPIVQAHRDWLKEVGKTPLDVGISGPRAAEELANERRKFTDDLHRWGLEGNAIDRGMRLLQESAQHWSGPGPQKDPRGIPCEGWLTMNAAMGEVGKGKYDSWRLFQVAFIVSQLPTFASRIPEFHQYYQETEAAEDANAVTLLYFATGGGKSEAFLGLLLFVLLLDRLRGKERGVSALMRYPLRLLTLQQARRTMKVLAAGEVQRSERGHPGEPLSLGYWVGGTNTPNWHSEEAVADVYRLDKMSPQTEPEVLDTSPYAERRKAWLKLEACPFCGAMTALRRAPSSEGGILGHYCLAVDNKCAWNKRFTKAKALPFYIVDEDIYRIAPSVLLGTVDKLAVIGQSYGTIRQVFGMFGLAPFRDPSTGHLSTPLTRKQWDEANQGRKELLFPASKDGAKAFFDPFPSLLIQDEAHLLEESLGTFAGLFESALDTALERLNPLLGGQASIDPNTGGRRRLKVIAASATVSEPERQMQNLYQRRTTQFPHPGPNLYTSFYSTPKLTSAKAPDAARLDIENIEQKAYGARVYTAIVTNGHRHTVAMASILGQYHLLVTELYEDLRSRGDIGERRARDVLTAWVSDTPLRPIHVQAIQQADRGQLLTLVDLHRIALTYVTNKKGGDQVIDTERAEFDEVHELAGFEAETLKTRLISGAVSASEIQAVVREAETRVKKGEEFPTLSETLRSIIATSAVSHGVDVEEFNAMFFAGLPSDIAEYIQASSRVGRTHVGFSVLVPVPQRQRDRFVVEIFDIYHRFLERMVLPAAVDRWAEKAIKRVMPSVVQEYLCGVSRILEIAGLSEDQKASLSNMHKTSDARQYLGDKANRERTIQFLIDALGLAAPPPLEANDFYRAMVSGELNSYLRDMGDSRRANTELKEFFKLRDRAFQPMTSLRDVDLQGVISPSRIDGFGHKAKDKTTYDAMAFIRRGIRGELDPEDDEEE